MPAYHNVILDALSTRWGSDMTATGTAVWFELDLRHHPGAGHGIAELTEARKAKRQGS